METLVRNYNVLGVGWRLAREGSEAEDAEAAINFFRGNFSIKPFLSFMTDEFFGLSGENDPGTGFLGKIGGTDGSPGFDEGSTSVDFFGVPAGHFGSGGDQARAEVNNILNNKNRFSSNVVGEGFNYLGASFRGLAFGVAAELNGENSSVSQMLVVDGLN